MEKLKIAFIGAGAQANIAHYPSVAAADGAEITAICDLNEQRLQQTADKYGVAKTYTDYVRMLGEEPIDAVFVVMYPVGVKQIVLHCLEQGKHVFLEKPPGVSLSETQEMAAAAQEHGCKSLVGFNRRYSELYQEAKRRILAAGKPTQALAEFHKNMLGKNLRNGVSVLTADIIHEVDVMRDILGEPETVLSFVDCFHSGYANCYNVLIRFEEGGVGILTGNRAAGDRYERLEIHGKGISAYLRLPDTAEILGGEDGGETLVEPSSDEPIRRFGYLAQTECFINCIRNRTDAPTDLADAVKTMSLVEEIERAGAGSRSRP